MNKASPIDKYLIHRIEDLFAKLAGDRKFTKLNMSQPYQRLCLDEESQKFVVINTSKGLFRYNQLSFGISSAPGIFQRIIENLLQGILNVVIYLDDILITGSSVEQHLTICLKC